MKFREFETDTIAAISTPLGEGGIGVVRLSGPEAIAVADKIFRSKKDRSVEKQKSFTSQYGHIVERETTNESFKIIDEVLLLVMRSPGTYTREDMVEISAHGGSVVLSSILNLALKKGARLAARGEFTKRAFLNGRLDLLQAEAVLDLIQAKTEMTREWAANQLDGALSKSIKRLKTQLVDILSHLEASVDFPDDFPETASLAKIQNELQAIEKKLAALLAGADTGILMKRGLRVTIAGRPNVGKSSLMNRLARKDRVIVTPIPGTTRDSVEEEIQIKGFPVRVVDTAGIQETSNPIEIEGIARAKLEVTVSDCVLYVLDASQPFLKEDAELLGGLKNKTRLVALNKMDLKRQIDLAEVEKCAQGASLVPTSCIRDNGTLELEESLFNLITAGQLVFGDEPVLSSVRQKHLVQEALIGIQNARKTCLDGLSAELVAIDVRLAIDHLGAMVGEVYTDDVLDVIFDKFCIGK